MKSTKIDREKIRKGYHASGRDWVQMEYDDYNKNSNLF
jgi:hypothetical protein